MAPLPAQLREKQIAHLVERYRSSKVLVRLLLNANNIRDDLPKSGVRAYVGNVFKQPLAPRRRRRKGFHKRIRTMYYPRGGAKSASNTGLKLLETIKVTPSTQACPPPSKNYAIKVLLCPYPRVMVGMLPELVPCEARRLYMYISYGMPKMLTTNQPQRNYECTLKDKKPSDKFDRELVDAEKRGLVKPSVLSEFKELEALFAKSSTSRIRVLPIGHCVSREEQPEAEVSARVISKMERVTIMPASTLSLPPKPSGGATSCYFSSSSPLAEIGQALSMSS